MKYKYAILGIVSVLASVALYEIGNNSNHLSEFKDFFWVPLTLVLLYYVL